MNILWENLKCHYLLAPVEGVIQLEVGNVCIVPGEAVPTGSTLETYNEGVWQPVDLTCTEGYKIKHYPLLHSSLDWLIPEQEPGYEYI